MKYLTKIHRKTHGTAEQLILISYHFHVFLLYSNNFVQW